MDVEISGSGNPTNTHTHTYIHGLIEPIDNQAHHTCFLDDQHLIFQKSFAIPLSRVGQQHHRTGNLRRETRYMKELGSHQSGYPLLSA